MSVFRGIASAYPTFARSTAMRLTFQARQTRFHSPVTLRNPRNENCLNPITDLMMPKTGSTVCLRSPYRARPALVASRCAILYRSSPDRETSGLINSRTTATKSSTGSKVKRRSSTAIASCPGVSAVLSLCGRCDKSSGLSHPFHLRAVATVMLSIFASATKEAGESLISPRLASRTRCGPGLGMHFAHLVAPL